VGPICHFFLPHHLPFSLSLRWARASAPFSLLQTEHELGTPSSCAVARWTTASSTTLCLRSSLPAAPHQALRPHAPHLHPVLLRPLRWRHAATASSSSSPFGEHEREVATEDDMVGATAASSSSTSTSGEHKRKATARGNSGTARRPAGEAAGEASGGRNGTRMRKRGRR
jgi:hypothetical protein